MIQRTAPAAPADAASSAAARRPGPQAVLALWYDVDSLVEDAFNDWYAREHFPGRLAVPGFRRARRFQAVIGAPRYFVVYDVDQAEVLVSPAYLEVVNRPSAAAQKMLPAFRGTNRSVCRVVARAGRGTGGWVAAWQLRVADARQAVDAAGWIATSVVPALAEQLGILGVQFWVADPKLTRQPTAEAALRGEPDRVSHWVIMVEGTKGDALDEALPSAGMAERGLIMEPPAVYRFLHGLGTI